MPMNNRLLRPLQTPGLLDLVPGAAAAYSLRSLSRSYAGPVVTVRRSTDDAEADFTASEVSDGTLAGWAGADGFVKQWWDQSGNARHATQATAAAQPQIVDSGVLVTEGGKAAVYFDGNRLLSLPSVPSISGTNERSFFFVAAAEDTSERTVIQAESLSVGGRLEIGLSNTLLRFRFLGGTTTVGPIASTETNLIAYILSPPANNVNLSSAYVFGVQRPLTLNLSINTTDDYVIGKGSGSPALNMLGTISELIIYPTDQTALRQRIEGNLAWYY